MAVYISLYLWSLCESVPVLSDTNESFVSIHNMLCTHTHTPLINELWTLWLSKIKRARIIMLPYITTLYCNLLDISRQLACMKLHR